MRFGRIHLADKEKEEQKKAARKSITTFTRLFTLIEEREKCMLNRLFYSPEILCRNAAQTLRTAGLYAGTRPLADNVPEA